MDKIVLDLCVVILHYNNIEDTIECVDSFVKNLDTNNYCILVFDNCSPNGSGIFLKKKYLGHKQIEVYLNDKNLGFGGGNNKGIEIVRNKYDPKFLVLSNNDIIMKDTLFYEKLEHEFIISHFAELGPMIQTRDGFKDSNPIFDYPYTRYACLWNLRVARRKLFFVRIHMYWLYSKLRFSLYRVSSRLRFKRPLPRIKALRDYNCRQENVVLHGCFMIFSRKFFDYYKGIDVRNFMYGEEDIIYAQIISKGMKTVYAPNILVYHKEGRSVSNTYGKNRKKEIFLLRKYIEAEKGYLSLLDDLEKEGFTFKEER